MANYADDISSKVAQPQSVAARSDQVANSAGGFGFALDLWGMLDRFLIIGTAGGTYYASERKLTVESAAAVEALLEAEGERVVRRIVEISEAGRAPKNEPALFALAMACGAPSAEARRAALAAIPRVARTGAHLLTFVDYADKLRGWGRGLRNAVARWYTSKDAKELGYQLAKYQSRAQQGAKAWSQRDVLRKCHAKHADAAANVALRWAVGKVADSAAELGAHGGLAYLAAHERMKGLADEAAVGRLIVEAGLTRESVPTQWLNSKAVWEALLAQMPLTAMVRNLGKMTAVGALAPLTEAAGRVCAALEDGERVRRSRLHPIAVLAALRTYAGGRGVRGDNTWSPVQPVVDALDRAFYLAFENVEATGKRIMLAVDCSGSMSSAAIGSTPSLTARDVAAAMAMAIARREPAHHVVGFTDSRAKVEDGIAPIAIAPSMRLDAVANVMEQFAWGGTDCALPMLYAKQKRMAVDAFVVITDNETWAGAIHPFQAMRDYREAMGIDARLVVMGVTATAFTIADPTDAGMLDVVGFDTATPQVVSDFIGGRI